MPPTQQRQLSRTTNNAPLHRWAPTTRLKRALIVILAVVVLAVPVWLASAAATNIWMSRPLPTAVIALSGTYTVGAGGNFTTLTAAVAAYNSQGVSGPVTFSLTDATYPSETFPITIGAASGSSATNTLTIKPAVGVSPVVNTTGDFLSFDLNGAANVIVDGSNTVGGTTKNLTIKNTGSGQATIRFVNEASNNTIKNSLVYGEEGSVSGGVVFFGTTSGTNGNDNNTISNNDIGPPSTNLPINGIHSTGSTATAAANNSGNTIIGNNIFDYFYPVGAPTAGVILETGNTDWTISNNRFYQTALRAQSSGNQHSGIRINNTSGNNFQITGNIIGFSNSSGTGTYQFSSPSASGTFVPISLNVGSTTATSVQGNTISGIGVSGAGAGTAGAATFRGIYVAAGLVKIGDVTGNTIGSLDGTSYIQVTSTSPSAIDAIGMYNGGTDNWIVSNNQIGQIYLSDNNSAARLFGVLATMPATNSFTCQNNVIGGPSVSFQVGSTNSTNSVQGITNSGAASTISGNIVRNLYSNGGSGGSASSAAAIGINVNAGSANHTVTGNTVYGLQNSNGSEITGIYFNGGSGANLIANNFVHSLLTGSTGPLLIGIYANDGAATYQNNMVRLGVDSNGNSVTAPTGIRAIYDSSGTNNYYFNSVHVGGSGVGTTAPNTYAFNSSPTGTTRVFKDNVFVNVRSNATTGGKHYAVSVGGSGTNPPGLTINNNVYYASGNGAVLGIYNSTDIATLAAWKAAVGQDAASQSGDPLFKNPNGTATSVNLHLGSSSSPASNMGVPIAGITTDIDGETRDGSTPDIGADEAAILAGGAYTIGLAGDYPTLQAASAAFSNREVTGPVTFTLLDATYPAVNSTIMISGGTGASSLTIKPAPGLSPVISGSAGYALIELSNVSNVTIDGSNTVGGTTRDLTISNTSTNGATIRLTINGSSNNFKNLLVKGAATNDAVIAFGSAPAGKSMSNETVQNCLVSSSSIINAPLHGIAIFGQSGGGTQTGNIITGNTVIDFTEFGIISDYNQNATISNNAISTTKGGIGNCDATFGIDTEQNLGATSIFGNQIGNLQNTCNQPTYGIIIIPTTGDVVTVANNFISENPTSVSSQNYGAYLNGSGTAIFYFNSIRIGGSGVTSGNSYGIAKVSSSLLLYLNNNIVLNARSNSAGTGKHYGIFTNSNANIAFDYNDIIATGTGGVFGNNGSDRANLAAWQSATSQDTHSNSADPLFTSVTDLHINPLTAGTSPVSNAGTPIAGITTDIDGETRNVSTPDIGADEFTAPLITVTGGPLTFPDTFNGFTSAEQTYTVSGSNLIGDITVTAPSTDFQVSKTTGTGFGPSVTFTQSGGSVSTSTVYVRFTPQSTGPKSGNVTNASPGATTQNVGVSGNGTVADVTLTSSGSLAPGTYHNVTISNCGTLATMTGDVVITGTLTINNCASLDTNGFIVSGGGAFTLNSGGTLKIHSANGITSSGASGDIQVTGTRTFSTGANYVYAGNANQAVGNGLPSTVANLTIANTGGGGSNTVSGNLGQIVTGLLEVSSGVYSSASDYVDVDIAAAGTLSLANNITVSGNWSNAGTFIPNGFGVTFDGGTGQTITGNTSFYDLTKSVAAAQTFNFTAGSLTTVTHALTLNGALGNLLTLRSTVNGSAWNLHAPATETVDYVDAKDSNASGGAAPVTATHSVNSGNNTNWVFTQAAIVYVDPAFTGAPGSDPDAGGPATSIGYDAFSTIQAGIDNVATGGTVIVAAGTYVENPSVTKAMTLKGAQFGVDARTRAASESIVRTSGAVQTAVFTISANNVTIDGFTIDGDDPGPTGITLGSGEDTNTSFGVHPSGTQSQITVQNNIIKRVAMGFRADGASQNNLINQNLFDSIGFYDFGYAVSLRVNYYADVTNNKMTRVWTGIHSNNHNGAGGPASYTFSGNEIHSYAGGILYWLHFNGATGATISNNQITAEATAVANNFGILIVTNQNAISSTITGNTITGHAYGVGLFNVPTTSTITLGATNSIVGSTLAGVFLTDHLNFNPVGTTNFIQSGDGAASTVNVTGLSITGNTGDGIKVEGVTNLQTINATGDVITGSSGTKGLEVIGGKGKANLTGSTITGFATGIALSGSSTQIVTAHFNRLLATTTAIDNPNNQTPNLENNWWGCNAGPGNTGCGTVTGTGADFNPWIVLGGSASPNSIAPSGTSTITADMTHNSDTLVPVGTLPDIPDSFSATNGTMNPTSDAVVAGTDTSLFTSTNNSSAVATITVDNQPVNVPVTVVLPAFSINDVTQNEGNGGPGTTSYTFTITKTGAGAASVDYATVNGTATAPSDYTAIPTTTLSFLSGDASKQFTVQVNGDTTFEAYETFTVHLSNAVNATISDADGQGTITNDDTCGAFSTVYVDASWAGTAIGDDPDGAGSATVFGCDSFATIQEGINAVTGSGTVNVAAGTYTENVTIPKALTLTGAGAGSVFLRPTVSNPNCGGAGGGSLCGGASNLILVQANNVTISGLTLDGDNPALTSSENFGGANIDARNGIITNHLSGVFNNIEVHHTTIKNIYLRGIYASSGGTFNFHDNTVQNVQANPASIGMFNFAGSGAFTNNNVSDSNDAISSNHSTGTTYTGNTITNSASGIHSDNAGDGGGTPDTISGNTVINSSVFGYGIWVFVPYKTVTVQNNTVTNVDVGLAVFGDSGMTTTTAAQMDLAKVNNAKTSPEVNNAKTRKTAPKSVNTTEPDALIQSRPAAGKGAAGKSSAVSLAAPLVAAFSASFTGNTVNGQNKANSTGAYFSTSQLGFGSGNPRVSATGNTIINNVDGFYLEAEDGFTLETAASFNRIVFNTNSGATQNTGAGFAGTVNGSMENNWWGCNAGPNNTGCGSVVGAGIDFNPWIVLGVSASPASIAPSGTSTVTADMTHNSDANVPAGVTTLPLPNASFTATNGTILPASNSFTSGQSQSTFTSTNTSSSSACGTVDTEQQCTTINVAFPSFSIDDVTLAEGNAGTTSFTFTITKTGPGAASVDYVTVNGTATAPTDYTAIPTTTLSFLSGDVSKQVTVQVNGDTGVETDETFNVHLSNAINATISDADGLGTITSDDACGAFSTVYVNKTWAGTAIGDDPDVGGPATVFGCDSFSTIQEGVNAVAAGGTVIVYAGNYPENVLANKSVTLQGPNSGVDPNTGSRVAEAIVMPAVVETSNQSSTSGTVFRVGTNSAHVDVTINGFTIDGHNPNPLLTGGRTLNGVDIQTGAGIVNSIGSFDTNPGAYDATMNVQNNIIRNFERYGVLADNIPSRPAVTGTNVSHNKIDNLPSGNNFGGGRGRGIAFEENVYGTCTFNVMTRVNVGWQDDNYNLASPGAATVVSHNTISTYHRGIFHNLQYQNASDATISDNSISVETTGDSPASTTNFGVELASIQTAVGVTVTNNNSTGNVYGILLWNLPTTANITVTGGTLTNNQYGVFATSNDPQFLAGAASHSIVSGVTITNASVAGIGVDDSLNIAATALEVNGNTTITSNALGAVGILVKGANASANVHDNAASIHDLPVGITVDGGSATITGNNLYNNVTGLRFLNGGTATAHFNRIISTTTAIDNPANSTPNLENNWWGCNAGPGNTGCGTVTGTGADFNPWIVLGVSASPASIAPSGTSTVTADMTHDSIGGTPAGVTTLPLPNASFTATNGTILPASNSFTSGQSQSTFTSTNTSSSSACGTVDTEQQCTTINVAYPSFSINDVTLAEGNAGPTSFTFTITKTGAGAASVDYATVNGTASAPTDYTAIPTTTLSFLSADTTKQVTVQVNGDTAVEANETFTVHLSNAINATIGDADGLGTITNDDACGAFSTVYVDDSWALTAVGDDPDGAGPATVFGCDSFATIQEGVSAVTSGGTVNVYAGTYDEDVAISQPLSLLGIDSGIKTIRGPIGGGGSTISVGASNVTIAGLTITRLGNTVATWNDPGLNTAGISIQGVAISNTLIRDNVITQMRTGIDINNSNGHTVRNNVITDNRTGMILRNQTDNLTVVENFITNNWTVGVLFLDASGGTNSPVQTAHHSNFNNNDLSGNWYGQIVDRQTGGSLPAPGTNNLKNFRGNWFGTASPITTTTNSIEPGYDVQIPVAFGGSATAPGGQPDIEGLASANFQINPILTVGTDTNVETTPGRGTNGFQGVAISQVTVVEPSSLHGWVFFDDFPGTGTGSGGFVDGPGTAPLGAGSAFLTVDALGRHALGTTAYIGTRMDDITELKYSSYQNNNTNTAAAISLQFDIDYDLNDGVSSYMGRLVFEPYITPTNTVQQGVWQNWDALAGKWWGTRTTVTVNGVAGVAQPCQQGTPCTWAQVLSLFPNAGIGNTPARALLFKAGGPVPGGFNGNVDDFSIKINTAAQTYDFEPNPHLSINDVSHNEGNAGTTSYDFTVTLSRPSSTTVTVDYVTANSSAVAPGDFTAIGTTQITFNPGETTKPVTVLVNGDLTNESDEQFFVNLSNPSVTADITDNQGVGTIVNDDAQPSFSIDDVTHVEGNPPGTTAYVFTVTKTGATAFSSSVQFQTVDGSATVADNDYTSNNGTLNFGPSDTSMQVTVLVNHDFKPESDEAFTVHLFGEVGATISDADGTGTITNDDNQPNVVYVDDDFTGPIGSDPDGAGPATAIGYDAFATIQGGVNGVAGNGTVNVAAGNYPENVTVPKSLSLLGPNASIDPNTGTRLAEAVVRPAVTETSIQGSTSGTIFRLGTGSGHIDVTIKGFTLDGNNPSLINGRTLNGVQVHTGAAIVNSIGSFDSNPGAFDTTMVVQNNIIQNLERYGVLADNVPARTPSAGTDVSFNKIDNLPSGNNFGGGRGRGIAFEENVYGSATFNVMTRVNVGWQDDNYNLASPGSGTLVDHNQIHTYHRGIFHNLQYQSATAATITNNQIFAETTGDFPASSTNFGVELASIQSAVGVTVTNNNSTGNVYGILLWNLPTTSTITVSGGTLTGNQYGVLATSNDPQFGAGSASQTVVSGVTVSGATLAGVAVQDNPTVAATTLTVSNANVSAGAGVGMLADGTGASMNITGSTITSCAKGVAITNGAVGNTITGNSIHDNAGLGIDLGSDGVTPNDPSDVDSGPNNLQNFPIIRTALVGTPNTIRGTLNSAPGQTFTIHLYASPTCDSSGNGEGQTLIGSTTATTNGSGDALWALNPASLTIGDFITATATDSAGNTSEFSACFQARAFTPGTITFNQVSSSETNSDHDVNVIVSRTGGSDGAVSVQYSVAGGTATLADNDYSAAAPAGTLTWANGDASDRLITISVKGDPKFEADETVLLTLSNPTGGASTGGTNPALTITNDDTAPSFSIDDVTHNEGNGGTTAYVFTVTKSGNTALNAGVNFQTADNSATVAGNDYQSQTGSLTFLPADTTKTVTVLVNSDTTVELDETFSLNLSGATNATINDNQGVGTISNDDTDISLSVSPASASEDGAANLVYTFTRGGVTTNSLTVNFSVSGGATFSTDYTQLGATTFTSSSGTVTFGAGNTTAQVTLDPIGDSSVESDETVVLTLTGGTGYSVGTPAAATGTITNDDTDVSVAVSPSTVLEDGAANLVYTFTRNGITTGALTANFSVTGGAAFGTDYTQSGAATFTATTGSVTFAAGSSTATVTIDPTTDVTVEPDETAILTVTAGTGYNVGTPAAATGTITNDDTDVSVAVSPLTVLEDGAANLVYTFTRNGITTGALTANFSVTGGAAFGTDYTQSGAATFTATTGSVTFAAGSSTATVTIDPTTDVTVEPDETAILTVTAGTGYNVGTPAAATGTITNDDTDVTLSVSPTSVSEDGAANLVYTFTRNGNTTGALTANFSVAGSATFNTDYTQSGAAAFTATSGTVTFAAGNSTATVTIDPSADVTVEPDETVVLTLTAGTGYNVATPSTATGTITNDEGDVSVAASPSTVPEDGATNLVYTFTRGGVNTAALTVNFTVAGTATFNSDYTQTGAATFSTTTGTVTFAAGSSTATVTIDPTTDVTVEPDETVILTVTPGTGYSVGSPSAVTGTIVNDDGTTGGTLQFSAASYNSGEGSFFTTITVRRLGDTTGAVSVNYATPDDSAATTVVPCETASGIASPRCDFTTAVGTLNWAAGDSAPKSFIVLISEDDYVEGPEGLTLTLSNPTGGAQLGSPSTAILTIDDDATEPTENPIDGPPVFVRQHYHDFLNREPDPAGFDFWVGNFTPCGRDPQCIEVRRINVSASFYLSIEFQGTGFFVERLYKSSYGDATGTSTIGGPHTLPVPIVKFSEFLPDTQEIGRGVVVLAPGWEAALEAKKVAFTEQFVQRARFLNAYPLSMAPAQFVDTLNANAGNPLSTAERNQLVSDLTGGAKTRAQVLRAIADDQDLINAEFNRGFVLMQYFGFLRRNPNAAPDLDHSGYDFWLQKLNQFNGNFIEAEMVKAFLTSIEYRARSGRN